jgi:hypothetical protein
VYHSNAKSSDKGTKILEKYDTNKEFFYALRTKIEDFANKMQIPEPSGGMHNVPRNIILFANRSQKEKSETFDFS